MGNAPSLETPESSTQSLPQTPVEPIPFQSPAKHRLIQESLVAGSPLSSAESYRPKETETEEIERVKKESPPTTKVILSWSGGGKYVYVTGTFNEWKKKIPLLAEQDYMAEVEVPLGTHQLKFIVDDEWTLSDDLPIASNPDGTLVNYLVVTNDITMNDGLDDLWQVDAVENVQESEFSQLIPEYHDDQEPPSLPPYLDRVLLNIKTEGEDPSVLSIPHHVSLNHLYACSIRDNVIAVACTTRYRQKFITTILYKPVLTE